MSKDVEVSWRPAGKEEAPDVDYASRIDEVKDRLASDLIALGKYCTGDMFTAISPDFHTHMEYYLRDVSRRYTVAVAPRGHAKSSIVAALLVLWHLFFEERWRFMIGQQKKHALKQRHIVIVSMNQPEAKRRLDTVKSILGDADGEYSRPLRALVGNWGIDTARRWSAGEVVLKNGTIITALGTGQQLRGLKKKHLRPTLAVIDDPEDELNTITSEALDKNRKWLIQKLMPMLDVHRGRIVVVGTPITTNCMVVKLMKTAGWRALWYQHDVEGDYSLWYSSDKGDWERREGILWPQYITRRRLLEDRETAASMGMLSSYYREHEAKIIGDKEQIFHPEYILEWDGELFWDERNLPFLKLFGQSNTTVNWMDPKYEEYSEPRIIPVLVFTGCDPAASTADTADKTAITNIAVTADDRIYVLPEHEYGHLQPDVVVSALAENHAKVKPFRGMVEVSAAFAYILIYLTRNHRITYLPDKPYNKKKGEGGRIDFGLQPHFAAQRVYLHKKLPVLKSLLLNYPRDADDWPDALEKAVRILTKPWHQAPEMNKDKVAYYSRPKPRDPMLS